MKRFHTRFEPIDRRLPRRLWLIVLSLIAILGLFSLNPKSVEATCGDYLDHGPKQAHSGFVGHDQPGDANHDPMKPSSQKAPCHGPFCQQGPTQNPLSAPVTAIEPQQDRWGWMADIVLSEPAQVSSLAGLDEPVTLRIIAFRLDRPPKV